MWIIKRKTLAQFPIEICLVWGKNAVDFDGAPPVVLLPAA